MSSVPRVTKERNEESITSSNDNVLVDGKDEGKKILSVQMKQSGLVSLSTEEEE